MKTILRPIKEVVEHLNRGYGKHWAVGGSYIITMKECGHVQRRKISQGIPIRGRIRCKECEAIRDGQGTTKIKRGNGPWLEVSWDSEMQVPHYAECEKPQSIKTML